MIQETLDGLGGMKIQENLDGSGNDEWYRKPWMVQETMNGTGNLDGSGDHEWYRKPGWFKRP